MKTLIIALLLFFIACSDSQTNLYELEEVNGYPVVAGSLNGLMWYIDDPDNKTTRIVQMNYSNAVKHCDGMDHAGFSDWRLPTISELRTLVVGFRDIEPGGRCSVSDNCLKYSCIFQGRKEENDHPCSNNVEDADLNGPGPEGCYFDDVWRTYCGKYWSSSKIEDTENQVFQIDFVKPSIVPVYTDNSNFAFPRCVREQ